MRISDWSSDVCSSDPPDGRRIPWGQNITKKNTPAYPPKGSTRPITQPILSASLPNDPKDTLFSFGLAATTRTGYMTMARGSATGWIRLAWILLLSYRTTLRHELIYLIMDWRAI